MARAGCIEFERGAGTPRVNAAPTKRIDFIATGKGMLAGVTVVVRRPHKRMKVGRWVGFFHRLVVLPLPTPPGFRPRIGVRGMPSIAGMTNGGPD